ncbi:MAG: M55 family metallopeptidase [Anaerolineae bacterium]|nr:M55 family metallopeptidase [Anaerolineae bacterium]
MKVYISVDMEGIACVTRTRLEGSDREAARRWMTGEANAAIEAAFEAGATEVVVADSHGDMLNILPDELDERSLLVRGTPRPLTMMEGLDGSFDAAFLIGYHAMSGTSTGVLAHTYTGHANAVRLNGTVVGETGFNAAIAGHFGVPVALVCGDDTLQDEVAALMPWTERVITKWAISNWSARSLTPKAAQSRIRAGAARALRRLSGMPPLAMDTPVRFEVELGPPLWATLGADVPGVERLSGRTLGYEGADMLDVVRVWRLILNASGSQTPL